jgi:hypothetical protein
MFVKEIIVFDIASTTSILEDVINIGVQRSMNSWDFLKTL